MADLTVKPVVTSPLELLKAKGTNETKPTEKVEVKPAEKTEPTPEEKKTTATLAAAAENKTGSTAQAELVKAQVMATIPNTDFVFPVLSKPAATGSDAKVPVTRPNPLDLLPSIGLPVTRPQQKAGVNLPITPMKEADLGNPAVRDTKFEEIVKTRGAASGATPAEIQTTLDTVKANNQKVTASKPDFEYIAWRNQVINQDANYRFYRDTTPEKLNETEKRTLDTNARFTENGTKPDAFWDKIKNDDLAQVAADRQKLTQITSNPTTVAQYEALKAEQKTLGDSQWQLMKPQRDNLNELVKVGVLRDSSLDLASSRGGGFITPPPDGIGRISSDERSDMYRLSSRYTT
jgi:hypothetical protein